MLAMDKSRARGSLRFPIIVLPRASATISEKLLDAQSDQTEGFLSRVLPGIEEGQD